MTPTFVVSDFPTSDTPMERRGLPTSQELPYNTFILDDSETSLIKYTSPFTRTTNDTCTGGTCTRLGSASASLEFSFSGTDVWLFGKTGGITRVFLDNTLVDVLDSETLTYNGSALWAANGLSQGSHNLKLAGVDGQGLNLLVDFFGVKGVVNPVASSTSTDPNYLPPEKLTPIIIGSVVGFLALLTIGALIFFLRLRRKKRKRISKSGIKIVKLGGSTDRGSGEQSRDTTLKGRLLSGILSIRKSSVNRGAKGMSGFSFGGRESSSTDGGNPFKSTASYASANMYPTAASTVTGAPYSPPTSADASVPLFSLPVSPASQQWQQQQRPPLVIPDSRAATTYSSVYPAGFTAQVHQAPSHQEERPDSPRSDRELGQENTPLMEARPAHPPSYYQHAGYSSGPATAASQLSDENKGHEFIKPLQSIPLPPRDGNGVFWSASTVSTFPTTSGAQSPPSQNIISKSHSEKGLAPPREESPPPPSFMSFDTSTPGPNSTYISTLNNVQVPPPPALTKAKTLKGPRPRGAPNASTTRPAPGGAYGENAHVRGVDVKHGTRMEEWDRLGGMRVGTGSGSATSRVGNLREEDEEPESPIDPAVQTGRVWY